ncbi:hypothetical protein QWY85_06075 [Neolewinella lacunae]|uniref:Outer membrane protein beta-barrel domain-containing protein n=1 Tax=Neolewinella lacunae TaxID=1517758 RepID=A0A923TD74_9BACT|nr:hypothetical protein [Neolewinella lacunae]MBC6994527.1 hypothetical protein [Neolewinella lacunae]MDN3634220.1 hypothetical protein [Neolewinella lacunae]
MKVYGLTAVIFMVSAYLFSQGQPLKLGFYAGPSYNIFTQTNFIQIGSVWSVGDPESFVDWQYGATLELPVNNRMSVIADMNFRPDYRYSYFVQDVEDVSIFGPVLKVIVVGGDEFTASMLVSYSLFSLGKLSISAYGGPGISINTKDKTEPIHFNGRLLATAEVINAMYDSDHPPTFMGSVGGLVEYGRISLRSGYVKTLSNSNTAPINVGGQQRSFLNKRDAYQVSLGYAFPLGKKRR